LDVYIHVFLTSTLIGGQWSASCPGRFTTEENAPCAHWIGAWIGLGTSLDGVERRKILPLPGLEIRPLGRPARSQLLYRLRYPVSSNYIIFIHFVLHMVGIDVRIFEGNCGTVL
jgi:hypothetical protein